MALSQNLLRKFRPGTAWLFLPLALTILLFAMVSCQKEMDNPSPFPENDSIYIKEVFELRGLDTSARTYFEYDSSKRPSRKTVYGYDLDRFITYFYIGDAELPYMIIVDNVDYTGDVGHIDTTYLEYSNGYVIRDSTVMRAAFDVSIWYVRDYKSLGQGLFKTTYRKYNYGNLTQTSETHSKVSWSGGNLMMESDTTVSSNPPFSVQTSNFTYDNGLNPFQRFAIPFPTPTHQIFPLGDISHMTYYYTVNPCNNNMTSRTNPWGFTEAISYQYNDRNLPVSAIKDDPTLPMVIKYYYTAL